MALDLSKIDPSSLVPSEQQLEDEKIAPLRSAMSEAIKVNPDEAANIAGLSRRSGIPVPAVATDPVSVQTSLNLKSIDFKSMADNSPKTAAYLSDYSRATVAHDDADALQELEGALMTVADIGRSLPAGAVKGTGMAVEGLGELYRIVGRAGQRTLEAAVPPEYHQYIRATADTPDVLKNIMGFQPSQALTWEGEKLSSLGEALGVPVDRRTYATDVTEALGQMGSQIAMTIANPAAGATMFFSQGVSQQAERQEETETLGRDVLSDTGLVLGGAVTSFSERIAIDKILNRLPPKVKSDIGRKMLDISIAGGIEAVQEVVENAAHGIIEIATTNPDAEIMEGATYEALVAGGAGSIARALLLTFMPGKVGTFSTGIEQKNTVHDAEQSQIDKIATAAEKVKLKKRDPESFKEFVASTGEDSVFLDSEESVKLLQGKTPEEIDADQVLKMISEHAIENSVAGTDIEVPMAEFTSELVGSPYYDQLRPHMKLNAESDTPARREQAQAEADSYVKNIMNEASENASQYAEAQDIFTTVRDQLVDTGRVTPQQAKTMADIVPAWATAQATRRGVSVKQVYEESGLRIEGPMTGDRARIESEGVRFEQVERIDPATEASEFRKAINNVKQSHKFGASVFVYPEEDYRSMDLFMSKDGKSGIAVKPDGDIVSAFSTGGGNADELIRTAINAGGRKLDAFDTVLPDIYAKYGFKEVRREPWSERFKPEGWDKEVFSKFNGGEPDVVYMEYDPALDPGREDDVDYTETGRDRRGRDTGGEIAPLEGAPVIQGATGPTPELVSVAERYAEGRGIDYRRQAEYVRVDPERAARIAEAYEKMDHDPQNPAVKEAYQNLIEQTRAQYDALVENGYEFYFFDETNDPYDGNPWNAMRDLRNNKRMGVFATEAGFGSDENFDPAENPLLEDTGLTWDMEGEQKRVLANDLFRAVHDAFGHGLEGAGFRADGEENAWQAHVRLFTGSAVGALTSETRGQNSWLNFGPYGDQNRTAKVEDTVFADQKTGLMPEWTWTDGIAPNIYRQAGGQEVRGYYEPANSLIRLTESSDLSTFLHEFSHFMYDMEKQSNGDLVEPTHDWFKRNADAVAKEANQNVKDAVKNEESPHFGKSLDAPLESTQVVQYLDTGATGDSLVDEAIERAVHEQFARGFETYVMEGTAPSIELRRVFRTFARWLAEIYRQVRGQLNVNLDDEMRQVFARFVATDEQIEAADVRSQFEPLFTDAAMAGMTETEFEDYQLKQSESKDRAHETLRDKLIKQFTRQTEDWWKAEKSDIAEEIRQDLIQEPVYAARERLRTGEIKMDRAAVKEMVGEEFTDKRGRKSFRAPPAFTGMHVAGGEGVHPDQAAAFFGYGSGSEMLADMINSPEIDQRADDLAEQRMTDKYGDILNDGTIGREADEAVRNEARGELILQELKALRKKTGKGAMERQMLQDLAEENIGRLTFRQINPNKYRKAELKAAQESAAALAKGDTQGAEVAKARQALNFYLGKAATQAQNDTLKVIDNMGRYRKTSVREAIMRAGEDYWEQLDKLLARFEFRKSVSLQFVDQTNQGLAEWMHDQIDNKGAGLVIDPVSLNESFVTHWKNLPHNQLMGIADTVKNIEHVARYTNKVKLGDERIEFNKLVNDWTSHMDEAQPTRFVSQRTDVVEGRNFGRWAMAQMTKIPYMASWLDGGERVGMSHRVLVQPFTDAYDNELKLWKETGTVVMDMIQNRTEEDITRHNQKVFIPEIKTDKHDGNLYGHQILSVALNTGNQGNLRKMLLGEGWANPDVEAEISFNNPKLQAVLSRMTKSDWEMVQTIWDQMDSLYPQLADVHRRTTGLTPPKVESTPVQTEYGEFRGGYYPVKYDPERSFRAELQESRLNAETDSMFTGLSIQASVNAGATNERTGYYAPFRLSLDVVPNHFQETIHYITHHDAVRQTNRLIRNPKVAEVIKAKLGPEEYAQLRPWLNDVAKDGRETIPKVYWDKMLQRLRFGTTLGVMGFSASTGIVQILGLSSTAAEVGTGPLYQSIRSILGSPDKMADAWQFAVDNSKVMNHRMQTMDREIKNAMRKIEGKRGVLAATQEVSMKHIAIMQTYMVDLPSWHAAYIKGMKDFDGDEARSYQYADWVVENIQGSGVTKDMSRIMRNQSETGRMLTMFMTFFSSLWNMSRDLYRGATGNYYSRTTVAAKAMFMFTVPVFLEMVLKGQLFDDDENDETALQKYLTNLALYPAASVPFVRDIAGGIIGDYGYNISPIAQLLESGTRGVAGLGEAVMTDEELTRSEIKGVSKLIGASFGVPGVNQMWKTGEHLEQVIEEGEDLTFKELAYGPNR